MMQWVLGYACNFNRILTGGRRQKLADFPQTHWTGSETTTQTFSFFFASELLKTQNSSCQPSADSTTKFRLPVYHTVPTHLEPSHLKFSADPKTGHVVSLPFCLSIYGSWWSATSFSIFPPSLWSHSYTAQLNHEGSSWHLFTRLQPKLKTASLFCAVTGPWTLFCCCTHYFLLRLSLCLYPLPISHWDDSKKAPYPIHFSILSI